MPTQAIGEERYARQGRWERWSGRGWAPASYAATPERLRDPAGYRAGAPLPEPERAALLRDAVRAEVLDGATVLDAGEVQAVLARHRPVSHTAHLVATVLTLGGWALVWLVCAVARREERYRLDVDAWGNVWPTLGASV